MPDIKEIVRKLILKSSSYNPFEICAYLNIIILFKDLAKVRGIYQNTYRKRIIYINSNLDPVIQRQVCAHELGHAILHRKINTIFLDTYTYIVTDKLEIQANMFAAELLIQDEVLKEYSGFTLDQTAAALEVQESLIEYKLKALSK